MPGNKTKIDRIHDLLPKLFRSRANPNWKAIVEALGGGDEELATLIEEVRKQLFIITANRPFIDRLGANVKVDRPRFVGMDDETFRKYIPVLSYQPKQVKFILDSLLDLFFFRESTTAFIQSDAFEPFVLEDGFSLEYIVDGIHNERIEFKSEDFTNINIATGDEIIAAINRQAQFSFAISFDDSLTKRTFIKLFSDTIGAKGSIEITGGRANVGLRFEGFITDAGNGINTEWTVTKVGDLVKFQHTAGDSPDIRFLQADDIIISNIANNEGSFVIETVDITNDAIFFRNLFGTPGVFTQTSSTDTKYLRPFKAVIYTKDRRAIVWETVSGKITVEMPASPPVVRRSLIGSAHINGEIQLTTSRVSDTSLEIENAENFPDSGIFNIINIGEIISRIKTPSEDTTLTYNFNTRLNGFDTKFTYTGKSGNILTGITPDLPAAGDINQADITSSSRNTSSIVTMITTAAHGFSVDETAIIIDTVNTVDGDPAINLDITVDGSFKITEIVDDFTFKYISPGDEGQSTGGTARVERISFKEDGTQVLLRTSKAETGVLGPYVWDTNASFVLSSLTATLGTQIEIGETARALLIGPNEIPDEENIMLLDFGTERQEGPIRILFKPTDNTIFIDPAFVFQFEHGPAQSSSVTLLRRKGPHIMSTIGTEHAPYITDTAQAREILQDLMLEVKSVGVFMEFLIRFPEQFYATLDVYGTGVDPG